MGLDISAYSNLVYLETAEDSEAWEDKYWANHGTLGYETVILYVNNHYPERATPIVDYGVYRVDGETHGFVGQFAEVHSAERQPADLEAGST